MNLTLIGMGAGVVALGVVAIAPNLPRSPVSIFEQAAQSSLPPESIKDRQVNAEFKSASLNDVVKYLGDAANSHIQVRLNDLEPIGVSMQTTISLEAKMISLGRLFDEVAERLSPEGQHVEWRFEKDAIELGTREGFDHRELTLASYDLSPILRTMREEYNIDHDKAVASLEQVVAEMVEPELWRENGGDTAHMQIVGGRMFIEAPPRMHKRVEWILQQLNQGGDVKDGQPHADGVPILKDLPLIDPTKSAKAPTVPPSVVSQGDLINIEIFNLIKQGEWYKATRTVDADGDIRLPVVGDIHAQGFKPREIEEAIFKKLHSDGILERPILTVYVTRPGNQTVSDMSVLAKHDVVAKLEQEYSRMRAERQENDPLVLRLKGALQAAQDELKRYEGDLAARQSNADTDRLQAK